VTSASDDTSREGWVEEFSAWVWTPPYWSWRLRGRSNATLLISHGRFVVRSRFVRGGWPDTDYRWPAVLIQTLRPWGRSSVLFEMSAKLASCSVPRSQRTRLYSGLERAGFAIVEERRLGWETPHPATREVLGARATDVPGAIVAAR
jgi:hypothetical protein